MNKISKNTLYLTLALSLAPNAYAGNIDMNTAHIQAMDKITGRVSELNIPVNGLANFGTFSILVRKCVTKSPEETPENTAFIDVVDNYQSTNPVNIFKGWMFSSTPGINGIEHPIYDIWLLKCYNSDASKHHVLNEEQLKFRDELPMVRQEKLEQTVKLSVLDEDVVIEDEKPDENNVEIIADIPPISDENNKAEEADNEIIQIDIDDSTKDTTSAQATEEVVEEEFIAEGEELVSETIVIDNEIVAQDEENQKTIEQETKDVVEEIIIDETE